jgi:hypothetical protein
MSTLAPPELFQEQQSTKWRRSIEDAVRRLNGNSGLVLLGLTVFYLLLVIPLALIKLLWADEFITYYIAKTNSIHGVWNAIAQGTDPNPPLSHLLVMWSMRLFGDSAFAVRIPAMTAVLVGVICVYLFLQRRLPTVYAAAGACLFLSTAALNYAYESRSYALILGFSMASLLLWSEATDGKHELLASVGLAITLGAGIASNYFCVLAFFPIAAGELVRDYRRRKIEWRIWIAIAIGALPFLFFLPLINHAISQFGPHAWNKPKLDVIADSYTEMVEVVLIPALAILAMGAVHFLKQKKKAVEVTPPVLPRHEMIAVFVMMLYPMLGYTLAVARAGMISPRFVLPVCWGFAIATVVAFYRMFSRNLVAAGALLLVMVSWAIARDGFCAYDYVSQRLAFNRVLNGMPAANTIVVADSLLVQPMFHYAPPQLAARIVFPLDFKLIQRYKREDSLEQNYWAGRGIFPVPIVSLNQLQENSPNYVVVAANGNWMLQKFEVDGSPATLLPIATDSHDIGGFTPLSHGETYFFEVGKPLRWDEQYAQTKANSLANWNRDRARTPARGMQQ